jgi:hypothetical protein
MNDRLGRQIIEGDKIAFITRGCLELGLVTAVKGGKITLWPDGAEKSIRIADTESVTIVVTGGVRKALTLTEILLTIREGITQVLQHENQTQETTDRRVLGRRVGLDRHADRHVPKGTKAGRNHVRRRGR